MFGLSDEVFIHTQSKMHEAELSKVYVLIATYEGIRRRVWRPRANEGCTKVNLNFWKFEIRLTLAEHLQQSSYRFIRFRRCDAEYLGNKLAKEGIFSMASRSIATHNGPPQKSSTSTGAPNQTYATTQPRLKIHVTAADKTLDFTAQIYLTSYGKKIYDSHCTPCSRPMAQCWMLSR